MKFDENGNILPQKIIYKVNHDEITKDLIKEIKKSFNQYGFELKTKTDKGISIYIKGENDVKQKQSI